MTDLMHRRSTEVVVLAFTAREGGVPDNDTVTDWVFEVLGRHGAISQRGVRPVESGCVDVESGRITLPIRPFELLFLRSTPV